VARHGGPDAGQCHHREITTTGTDAKGQNIDSVVVYDKQ
jgi:hypothetical protein